MLGPAKHLFETNQFLLGGFVLGIIAAVLASLKKVPGLIARFVRRKFVATLEVKSNECIYGWINFWLSNYPTKKFTFVKAVLRWHDIESNGTKRNVPIASFSPAPGFYFIKYKRRRLLVNISQVVHKTDEIKLGEENKILITKFGRNKELFSKLISESYDVYNPTERETINIYHMPPDGNWKRIEERKLRNIDTLYYEEGILEKLLNDAKNFLTKKKWYEKMGIPYRRGYFLYGEPGNGKSSFIIVLGSYLKRDVYILSIGSMRSDEDLIDSIVKLPDNSIVALEDVDVIFKERKKNEYSVTLSCLLNCLDGSYATEGRILIMTTNHKEKLDPALIRPGRADVHQYIGNAKRTVAEKMFKRFFENANSEQISSFGDIIDGHLPVAAIQEYLIENQTIEQALNNKDKLK